MTTSTGAGLYLSPAERDINRIVYVARQLIEGRGNNVGFALLNSTGTSTRITAITCGPNSIVQLTPTTAHAAAQAASTYVNSNDITPQQFYVTHASTGQTDLRFMYSVHG